ncbi:MAG: hypothetical protein V8Q79_00655 [Christensenellales bacterium]
MPQTEILPAQMPEEPPKKTKEARLCVPQGLEPPAQATAKSC